MATFRSSCPQCGEEIVRHYGNMGEGLLAEEGCDCNTGGSTWVEKLAAALALLALLYLAVR